MSRGKLGAEKKVQKRSQKNGKETSETVGDIRPGPHEWLDLALAHSQVCKMHAPVIPREGRDRGAKEQRPEGKQRPSHRAPGGRKHGLALSVPGPG